MGIFDFFKRNEKKLYKKNKEEIRHIEQLHFTEIDVDNLENYYDWTLNFGKRKINIDLNFEMNSINQSKLDQILKFINEIPKLDVQNRSYIKSDFNKMQV